MKLLELLNWYENLSPERLGEVNNLYHEQARFIDPFNDVEGPAAIRAIFSHMYKTTQAPRFTITQHLHHENLAWVQWQFDFRLDNRDISIEGSSELHFAEDGRVQLHKDYWDASALMQELPWVGKLIFWLRNKMRTPQSDLAAD